MSHRQRMPQMGSRKWSRIANHKRTHFQTKRFQHPHDVFRRMEWVYRWLHLRAAVNPRWRA